MIWAACAPYIGALTMANTSNQANNTFNQLGAYQQALANYNANLQTSQQIYSGTVKSVENMSISELHAEKTRLEQDIIQHRAYIDLSQDRLSRIHNLLPPEMPSKAEIEKDLTLKGAFDEFMVLWKLKGKK